MIRLDIALLGEPRMWFDGAPWRFSAPPKCLPLLALLAVAEAPASRTNLAAQLWPDDGESEGRANLRRHIHQLTRALPKIDGVEWVTTDGGFVAWNRSAPARLDVAEFTIAAADPTRYADAAQAYQGDLLESIFDEAVVGERERLRGTYLHVLFELAQRARGARDYATAARQAEILLALDEWREDALRLLMSVRYAVGDRSGALAAFERFARRLHDELQAEPMFETLALRDAIVSETLPRDAELAPTRGAEERPLLGRSDEIASLQERWHLAAAGSGTTVFLAGEAGIGKTRLAHEMIALVEAQGGRAVVGRTSSPESMPYQPMIEALRQMLPFIKRDGRDDAWLATLAPLVPAVQRLYTGPEAPPLDGDRGKLRLFDAIVRAVQACARVRPVMIALEDLHVARQDTIELVETLAERLAGMPVLLLATYRSTDAAPDSPLRALRRKLQRASLATHVSLSRLALEDVEAIVRYARGDADASLARRIYDVSEGNPLFVWQLVHQHVERGGALDVQAAIATIGDAVRNRLALLDDRVRAIADVAATIGDTFTIEEIASVGGWDESDVGDALATLLDRQLIAERGGSGFEYGFTHALIGAAIYDGTPESARSARHRRAADVLQRTRAEHGLGQALVASHWERAGDAARARRAYLEAARFALSRYAREDARDLARMVLDRNPDASERFAALQVLIAATDRAGDVATAQAAVEELRLVARELGPCERHESLVTRVRFHDHHSQRDAQAQAIEELATFAELHDRDEWRHEAVVFRAGIVMQRGGTAECERILRTVDPRAVAPKLCYRYYSLLAQSLFRQGRHDEGLAVLAAFRALLDEHPSLDGESQYAYAAHKHSWVIEDAAAIKRTATRIVALAQRRGDLLDEANGRIDLAYITHQLHDTSGARAEFERALALFERCQSRQGWVNTRINYGVMEREIGHIERGVRYWREGQAVAREIGVRFAQSVVDINDAELLFEELRYAEALPFARAAFERIEGSGERNMMAFTNATLGIAEYATGARQQGLARIAAGLGYARSVNGPMTVAGLLCQFLEAALRVGRVEDADESAIELAELFEADPNDHRYPGRIAVALAEHAERTGHPERAEAFRALGREAVSIRYAAFTEQEDRDAFLALRPNGELLGRNLLCQ